MKKANRKRDQRRAFRHARNLKRQGAGLWHNVPRAIKGGIPA